MTTRLLRGLFGVAVGALVALINCWILARLGGEHDLSSFSIPALIASMNDPTYMREGTTIYTMSPLEELYFLQAMFLPSIIGLIKGLAWDDWFEWWKIPLSTLISVVVNIVLFVLLAVIMLFRSGQILLFIIMIPVFAILCGGGAKVILIIIGHD